MQFIIYAYDGKDAEAPNRRKAARPDHLANIKTRMAQGAVLAAGGILGPEGGAIGSYLVMEFADRQELDAYLQTEPYVIHKVWQEIKVEACNTVVLNNEMIGS